MTQKAFGRCPATARTPIRQRGAVLLFALIALVVMLLAAVALVRSFNNSLFAAGNIGFKRDMQFQSERAADAALTAFRGTLNNVGARSANVPSKNYSATTLPTNAQGIPNDLVGSDAAFAASYTAPDLASTDGSVTVRYLIDRLCATAGDETTMGTSCVLADNPTPAGTSSSNLLGPERSLGGGHTAAAIQGVVYRLSVRVTGPRRTQSFFQSTFTVPS